MAIRGAYAFYKEIRLEVIMAGKDSEIVEPAAEFRVRKNTFSCSAMLGPNSRKETFKCVSGTSRRSRRRSPAWKLRATCRQNWIALNPRFYLGNRQRRSGAAPGRRFVFGGLNNSVCRTFSFRFP